MLTIVSAWTNHYFFCTRDDLLRVTDGVLFPAPNLEKPRLKASINPFTKEPIQVPTYRALAQPPGPATSTLKPDFWQLPSHETVFLDALRFSEIAERQSNMDSTEISLRLDGQTLVHSLDEKILWFLSSEFWHEIPNLDDEVAKDIARVWGAEIGDPQPRKLGFFARLFGPSEPETPKGPTAEECCLSELNLFRDFTRRALDEGKDLFLLATP